jgi:hypothetical protein
VISLLKVLLRLLLLLLRARSARREKWYACWAIFDRDGTRLADVYLDEPRRTGGTHEEVGQVGLHKGQVPDAGHAPVLRQQHGLLGEGQGGVYVQRERGPCLHEGGSPAGTSKPEVGQAVADERDPREFDAAVRRPKAPKAQGRPITKFCLSSSFGEKYPLYPETVAAIIALAEGGKISRISGKLLFKMMVNDTVAGKTTDQEWVTETVAREGLLLSSASSDDVVAAVIGENPKAVEEFRGGKQNALNFLVGKCMQKLKAKGDPVAVRKSLLERMAVEEKP